MALTPKTITEKAQVKEMKSQLNNNNHNNFQQVVSPSLTRFICAQSANKSFDAANENDFAFAHFSFEIICEMLHKYHNTVFGV